MDIIEKVLRSSFFIYFFKRVTPQPRLHLTLSIDLLSIIKTINKRNEN